MILDMRGRLILLALAACGNVLLAGCSRQGPSPPYIALSGVVRAIDLETGELLVRAEHPPDPWHADRNVPCVATKDSELYINDRFSDLRDVRFDDAIEAIGYRDQDRFVLSLVNISRDEPQPAAPKFVLDRMTKPATDKHED